MPKRAALIPTVPTKVYLSPENAASLQLLSRSDTTKRAIHGRVSEIVNDALAEYFSPTFKEYLQWKAQKQQPESTT